MAAHAERELMVADVERTAFGDPRLHARMSDLRQKWRRAETAYADMVTVTEHAKRWLAARPDDVSPPPSAADGREWDGKEELGARLVAVERAAIEAVQSARESAQEAVRCALECVSEQYRCETTLILDVDARTARGWTEAAVAHVTRACRGPADPRVVLF